MQRAVPEQKLGVILRYHNQHRFYYLTWSTDSQSSLAYRAGIQNFDRVIELNGINVENDTDEQIDQRFDVRRDFPVEILVCNPSTYQHYKSNNKTLHRHLPTVQRLKPVYDTSGHSSSLLLLFSLTSIFSLIILANETMSEMSSMIVNENIYCAIQWIEETMEKKMISIVSQSTIFKSPDFICINDICVIEFAGNYYKGKILYKGSRHMCEIFQAEHDDRVAQEMMKPMEINMKQSSTIQSKY
ncbi:unnamed protein product [Rotaria sordida]|uniref:PDZ domain-containing protein n=1 Tax=Rotaria sordida TaxID=392033 RepID=A0A814UD85_9BILA|nr:unnamed protein product [Rotaria sordida]CAF1186153.1 unnamed protein product [Rotaria sordida]